MPDATLIRDTIPPILTSLAESCGFKGIGRITKQRQLVRGRCDVKQRSLSAVKIETANTICGFSPPTSTVGTLSSNKKVKHC